MVMYMLPVEEGTSHHKSSPSEIRGRVRVIYTLNPYICYNIIYLDFIRHCNVVMMMIYMKIYEYFNLWMQQKNHEEYEHIIRIIGFK